MGHGEKQIQDDQGSCGIHADSEEQRPSQGNGEASLSSGIQCMNQGETSQSTFARLRSDRMTRSSIHGSIRQKELCLAPGYQFADGQAQTIAHTLASVR